MASDILDEDHYGLEKVKKRDPGVLGCTKTQERHEGSIVPCGSPGVGKTSLAKSVSRALGRKMQRMSLGGVRDEAEIRGIGVLHWFIARQGDQKHQEGGFQQPVFVLDEIDKLGADYRGDPSSALLRFSTQSKTTHLWTITWMFRSTFPRCCSLRLQTKCIQFLDRCATGWKCSKDSWLHHGRKAENRAFLHHS